MNNLLLVLIAYLIGLLSAGLFRDPFHRLSMEQGMGFVLATIAATLAAATIMPRWWRLGPTRAGWVSAGMAILFASFYFQLRLPQPNLNDISQQLGLWESKVSPTLTITGEILTPPQITRSQKAKLLLKTTELQIDSQDRRQVTGKLYVTLPLLQATALYPSQTIALTGQLYQPSSPLNPGGLDFQSYLRKQGIFAGFTAQKAEIKREGNLIAYGLWQLRRRIVQTHVRYLKVPRGNLVSSMVLGRRAVDLPYEIQDLFIETGLAHILAASGFHVSLLLGVVLWCLRGFADRIKLTIGLGVLLFYLCLTGFFPSVLRAAVMGIAALIGMVGDRQVRASGSLLVAATVLLLLNPLWIWDLGFQLSFLATWGLSVTLPGITRHLDWLPPNLANLIAVPLAASVWTLPVQIFAFNTIPLYGVLLNMIVTPLAMIISLGGMVAALVGVFIPLAGSYLSCLLLVPAIIFLAIVKFFGNLPFNYWAVGQVSVFILIICYLCFICIWLIPWCQKRRAIITLFLLSLTFIPIVYQKVNLVKITVFAVNDGPAILIQNKGQFTLINNSADREDLNYNILPTLREEGINKLNFLVSVGDNGKSQGTLSTLSILKNNLTIEQIISNNSSKNKKDKPWQIGGAKLIFIDSKLGILKLEFRGKNWLFLREVTENELNLDLNSDILLWSGKKLEQELLAQIRPEVAIAFSQVPNPETYHQLARNKIKLYSTRKDGAIQWTPRVGFQGYNSDYAIILD